MADPLSFAASIIAVTQAAQAAGQLLFAIQGYYVDVRRAPSDIRKLKAELESLQAVLARMVDYGKKNVQSTAIKDLNNSLNECIRELTGFHKNISKDMRGWRKRLKKLKWPLQKKETMEILARIERHKSTFNLGLATENIVIVRSIEENVQCANLAIQGLQAKSEDHISYSMAIGENVKETELGVQKLQAMSEDHVVITKNIGSQAQHIDSVVRDIQEEQHARFSSQDAWRKEEEKMQTWERRKRILNWVFPNRYDKKHIDISTRRRKGTGKWLLETPEVQKWITDPDHPILWGRGIPGAGKTFLSSAFIDHVDDQVLGPNDGVAHIYFDYKEQEQQKATDVLASLVKQLANQTPNLPAGLEKLHDKLVPKDKRPTLNELFPILLATFKSFSRVFLIFDALDECHQSNQRKDILPLLHRMSINGVNLFVTSRPFPEDIQASFQEHSVTKLELLAREEDITIYIKEKISENPRAKRLVQQANCQQRIISELVDCAKGMFLLVHFHIKYICQQTTAKQILEALDKLKSSSKENKSLDPTYNKAMENLRSQSKSCATLAFNILSWLVKARRPMTADEIRIAVSIQPGRYELDELDLPANYTLLDVCAGLVMIDENSNTIKLVHYTVQEYLLDNGLIPDDADLKLAVACTTYLSFDVFANPSDSKENVLERLRLHPLLRYVVPHLTFHLRIHDENIDLVDVVKRFFKSVGNVTSFLEACENLDVYSLTFVSIKRQPNRKLREWEIFSVACTIGHYATAEMLLGGGAGFLGLDAFGYSSLILAAMNGYLSIVQLLLSKGADLEVQDKDGWTALHLAVSEGHQSTVQLLLDKGADLEVQGKDGWTALHLAAWEGHQSTVQLLLDKGADLEVQEKDGRTALHLAASKGHQSTVQLLLDKGADLEVQSKYRRTALHLAASKGHQSTVQLLLDKGADLEVQEKDGWTALHLAASKGHQSTVQLLLDKGADLEVQSKYGRTALHLAASEGHQPTVQLLLGKGADLEVQDKDGRTALHEATDKEHQSVVQLLLDRGASLPQTEI